MLLNFRAKNNFFCASISSIKSKKVLKDVCAVKHLQDATFVRAVCSSAATKFIIMDGLLLRQLLLPIPPLFGDISGFNFFKNL